MRKFALDTALHDAQLEVRDEACTLVMLARILNQPGPDATSLFEVVVVIRTDSPQKLEKLCSKLSKSILKAAVLPNLG